MPGPAPQGPEGRSSFFRKPAAPPVAVTPPPPPPPPTVFVPPPPPPPVPRAMEPPPPASGGVTHRLVFHGRGGIALRHSHRQRPPHPRHARRVLLLGQDAGARVPLGTDRAIAGDRFAYHGTGREIFIGFLKAMVFFALPLFLLSLLRDFTRCGAVEVALRVSCPTSSSACSSRSPSWGRGATG